MTSIAAWLKTRTGRLVTHDLLIAAGAGFTAWQAAGSDWTWGAWTAAGVVAGKTLLRIILPVPNRAPKVRPVSNPHSHSVYHRYIPEVAVSGKPLGRHVHHDSRSLNFLAADDGTVATVRWDRHIPVLNQGQVGSCTGNATVGVLGTSPDFDALTAKLAAGLTLNEAEALTIYSAAEVIDGNGPYPPNDNGSSGLSVAKAAKNAGLISGYTHITSIGAAKTAIQTGPFIVGTNWYTGMDTPNAEGVVTATGSVRGGHEYECIGYDVSTDLWEFVNSWGDTYGIGGHFYYSTATFTTLLSQQGDATVLLPLTAPAPTPGPSPVPTSTVTVTDATVVAHIGTLAAKNHEDSATYLTNRLKSLWRL